MLFFFRNLIWRILGLDYQQVLKIHDYVFLKNDPIAKIGHKSYDNGALVWRWSNSPLNIGRYCSIANNVRFIVDEGYHTISGITSYPLANSFYKNNGQMSNGLKLNDFLMRFKQKAGINVGNDVWIGMNSIILPGVRIGDGVTIAANSTVTKDIPDYSVVAGNPAKIIRFKFDDGQIKSLKTIKWWDWSEELIKERMDDFYKSPKIFIEKYQK